jgi:hypothetical protein
VEEFNIEHGVSLGKGLQLTKYEGHWLLWRANGQFEWEHGIKALWGEEVDNLREL